MLVRPGLTIWPAITGIARQLFGSYFGPAFAGMQIIALSLLLVALCIPFAARGDFRSIKEILFDDNRFLLLLWSFGYLAFLIVVKSSFDLGDIPRLVIPAGITLGIVVSALVVRVTKARTSWIMSLTMVLLLLAIVREVRVTLSYPVLNFGAIIPISERLDWIEKNTSDRDLIIGDDTMDIPFYLQRTSTISFSPYPTSDYPTYNGIVAYSRRHCNEYRDIYLVLRTYSPDKQTWTRSYGDFFADLAFSRIESYPQIALVAHLSDATVFKIQCR